MIKETTKNLNKGHHKANAGKLLGNVEPTTSKGGSLVNTLIGLATDIVDVFYVLPRQLQIIAKMIDELGGNATGAQLDTFSQTSEGSLFWGNKMVRCSIRSLLRYWLTTHSTPLAILLGLVQGRRVSASVPPLQ